MVNFHIYRMILLEIIILKSIFLSSFYQYCHKVNIFHQITVCYREAAPEQFDAFTEELKQEGKLTGDTKVLMEQLDEKPNEDKKAKVTKSNVSQIHVLLLNRLFILNYQ